MLPSNATFLFRVLVFPECNSSPSATLGEDWLPRVPDFWHSGKCVALGKDCFSRSDKKKKQWYITRRSVHSTQTNAHDTTLHHHYLGEELKASRQVAPWSPTLCHMARCKPKWQPKLLHHWTTPVLLYRCPAWILWTWVGPTPTWVYHQAFHQPKSHVTRSAVEDLQAM
jgi:hypothetical protein